MSDTAELERRGIPTVCVTHDTFELAAKTHADLKGMPDLRLAVTPRPRGDWDESTKQEAVADLFQKVQQGILAAKEQRLPS
ncbi:MAG: hypothetical protein HY329_09365 [Chloroflexi bacterium]|nr:hypothetical protein [Chloroflexota bacterium]